MTLPVVEGWVVQVMNTDDAVPMWSDYCVAKYSTIAECIIESQKLYDFAKGYKNYAYRKLKQ